MRSEHRLTKRNVPKLGATVAERDFKSMGNSKKAHVPRRVKEKAAWGLAMIGVNDSSNPDSNTHPINKYSLVDVEEAQAYTVSYLFPKNRTGTEGRTKGEIAFINGGFDTITSLVIDCKNFGIFKEGGMYPSADEPTIFKGKPDAEKEYKIASRYRKTKLQVKGYNRPTNIIEARLLLNYTGDDPELCEAQGELYSALLNALEDKLKYELDSNCVTNESLNKSSIKFNRYKSFMSRLKREEVLDPNQKIEMPDKVGDIDGFLDNDENSNE